jgi:microcystin-dependent protein
MTTVYVGQIELFAFSFAPRGWAQCNGQLLAINTNEALFSLLGTQYGGDGIRTFGLPDLRGRVPVGFGPDYPQGQIAGEEQHTLLTTEMPAHPHLLMGDASTAATSNGGVPTATTVLGNAIGTQSGGANFNVFIYSNAASNGTMAPQALSNTGGGTPHDNRMPYLALNFCIALFGLFPSRN